MSEGKELKDIIRQARREKNLTMGEFAERVGVSRASVVKIESGETKTLKSTVAARAARVLDLPLSVFSGPAAGTAGVPVDEKGTYVVKIEDDSLSPYIESGDSVLIREESDIENGKAVAFKETGKDYRVRIIESTTSGIRFKALNEDYETLSYRWTDLAKSVSVLGVVTEIRKPVKDGELLKKEG